MSDDVRFDTLEVNPVAREHNVHAKRAWRRLTTLRAALLGAATVLAAVPRAEAAAFDDPAAYCAAVRTIDRPDARYVGDPLPDRIARALMRATDAPADAPLAAFKRAAWRCDGGRVLACSFGANIPCEEKADTRREPGQGARAFCREKPGSDVVPAAATGHSTVFAWRCEGARPVIARQVLEVDRRGFPAAFWYVVAPAGGGG